MPRKSISFDLDFVFKDIFPRFTVKQFDDVTFNIKPKLQGSDYDITGMTGKIFVGVNNDVFMQTQGITVTSNNIDIVLDKNMLQKNGRAYAEIELTDSNGTITSSSFIFNIDAKVGEGGQIPGGIEGFVQKYERLISEFKSQVNSSINSCNDNVANKLNSVDAFVNTKISDFENRFNTLTSSKQQDAEVIDARGGENSLKARLDNFDSQLEHIAKNHVYISEFNGTVQEAINYCINNKFDLIINKDLVITETLKVNNTNGLGCRIVGTKNKPIITLDSSEDIPLFYFYGGSGSFSNTGVENITLATTSKHLNTAIKINGVCNGKFKNIFVSGFKYGLHLCNDTGAGVFTELNNFNDITLNDNVNGIRMEQLLGDNSFHGNNFESVYINVYANQIGFNHVSGYYYNGNFRIYMWAHGENAIYLSANGNAENNIGSITYESFRKGKITGNGKFWFNGKLTGIGGINDETSVKANGEKIISCDNYKTTINHEIVGRITSIHTGNQYNGVNAGIYGVSNDNEKSFLMNGFKHSDNSKLYLGETSYNCDLDKFNPGLHFTLNGKEIKTYNDNGLTIKDKNGNSCANFNNGKLSVNAITGNTGNHNKINILASSQVQTITLTGGIKSSEIICLASVVIKGSNYEQRMLYSVNHNGYGGNGSCTKLATHYTLNASGVEIKSITVDPNGNLVISILTDRDLTFITKYQGIGIL